MPAIAHAFAEINSSVTTSSTTFVDVTGVTLSSSNFTAGKKYLIFVTGQFSFTASSSAEVRVVHGSTEFDGSKSWVISAASNQYQTYCYATVWTAVSSEAVTLQFRDRLGGANVSYCNFASIFVMNLSDDIIENTDWFFNEVSADDVMSTSFEDGASITVGAGTWLVIGNILTDSAGQIVNYPTVRLTDGTNVLPQAQIDIANSGTDERMYGLARVYSVGSTATYKVQYKVSASTTANALHSRIFALNLEKFRNYAHAYTSAAVALSTTDFATQIQTLNITPDVQGDVWIGSYWTYDKNSSGNQANQRLQVDNNDVPSGQTAAVYNYRGGIDPTDEESMMMSTLVANMTAASHAIDVDGSVDTSTSTPEAEDRTIWALTMELAQPANVFPLPFRGGRGRMRGR